MKRDVLVIVAGMLVVGVVVWAFWGNPERAPRVQAKADRELMFVFERSPYMSTGH